jgi:hypothetical protein
MTRRAFTATIANHSIQFLAIAAVTTLWPASAFAAQTWTYQFTPTTTQPYVRSCGECGGYLGSNADVAGTFTILLNWETHVGKIRFSQFAVDHGALDRTSRSHSIHSAPRAPTATINAPPS